MQLAAAGHLEGIRGTGVFHFKAYVNFKLFFEPFLYVARRDVLAFLACERALVDDEVHRQRGFFYGYGRKPYHVVFIADRVAYGDVGNAAKNTDIAGMHFGHGYALHSAVHEALVDLAHDVGTVGLGNGHLSAGLNYALVYAPHAKPAHIIVVAER